MRATLMLEWIVLQEAALRTCVDVRAGGHRDPPVGHRRIFIMLSSLHEGMDGFRVIEGIEKMHALVEILLCVLCVWAPGNDGVRTIAHS